MIRIILEKCAATGNNFTCSAADNYCANNVESIYDDICKATFLELTLPTQDHFSNHETSWGANSCCRAFSS